MMSHKIRVAAGPPGSDFAGFTHRSLQAAVDYVSSFGGGTVEAMQKNIAADLSRIFG